ncbi:MAG: hypothetical protein Q7S95_01605 [bacterium]|nr:hypothetical protein [bacterium]
MVSAKILWIFLALLAVANIFVYWSISASSSLVAERLSAGEGSAVLIRAPGGRAVLVGAGPDASILRALGEALPPWQRSLDALILLDVSANGEGGAPFVLERYRVAHLLRAVERGTPTREAALASAASAAHVGVKEIPQGAGLILHYGSLSLPLSASTTPGQYSF